jgi:hypothetical protein
MARALPELFGTLIVVLQSESGDFFQVLWIQFYRRPCHPRCKRDAGVSNAALVCRFCLGTVRVGATPTKIAGSRVRRRRGASDLASQRRPPQRLRLRIHCPIFPPLARSSRIDDRIPTLDLAIGRFVADPARKAVRESGWAAPPSFRSHRSRFGTLL